MLPKVAQSLAEYGNLWAITSEGWQSLMSLMAQDSSKIQARVGDEPKMRGTAQVIKIQGPILPKESWLTQAWGLCSYEGISRQVREAEANPDVESILLDVYSPGGTYLGCPEAATSLASAQKPMKASVTIAASAAYYLASQADEIEVTPSGSVGSIGTIAVHLSFARMVEKDGVDVTVFRNPPFKGEGHALEQLSDEAKDRFQSEIDKATAVFQESVAEGRKVSLATVKDKFGKGRMLSSDEALNVGMVDSIVGQAGGNKPQGGTSMPDKKAVDTTTTPTATPAPTPAPAPAPAAAVPTNATPQAAGSIEQLTRQLADAQEARRELEAKNAKLENRAAEAEASAISASLPNLPIQSAALNTLLAEAAKSLSAASNTALTAMLTAVNAQLGDLPGLTQQGREARKQGILARVDAQAKTLVASGRAASIEAARGLVFAENVELAKEYSEAGLTQAR